MANAGFLRDLTRRMLWDLKTMELGSTEHALFEIAAAVSDLAEAVKEHGEELKRQDATPPPGALKRSMEDFYRDLDSEIPF